MRSKSSKNQMSLDFDGEALRRPKGKIFEGERLFFAIRPSLTAKEKAHTVASHYREEFALKGELRFDLLHVTLIMVAEKLQLPEHVIFAAKQVAATIGSAPVTIRFDQIMSFGKKDRSPEAEPRALVLLGDGGKASLTRLYDDLRNGMRSAGLGLGHDANRPYTPHMTLLYDRKGVPPTELDEPVCWTADEFVLIRSPQGKSTHLIEDRWPLLG